MQKKSRQAAKYYKAGRIDVFEQNWTMPNPKQIQAKYVYLVIWKSKQSNNLSLREPQARNFFHFVYN